MKAMVDVDAHRVVSTACSGSGMGEIVFHAVMQFLGQDAKLSYSCENVPFKQRFLQHVVHPAIDKCGRACLFKDLNQLSDGSAGCMIHGSTAPGSTKCIIQHHGPLTIIGYSCKTLSSNNPTKKQHILKDGVGSSGETYNMMADSIQACRPRFWYTRECG